MRPPSRSGGVSEFEFGFDFWIGATALENVTQAVILCGGQGLRSRPETVTTPKPLLSLLGRPLVVHVMETFALHGIKDFVLLAGYKAETIVRLATTLRAEWNVRVIDTGEHVEGAQRLMLAEKELDDRFFLSYCDCLSDISLRRLAEEHDTGGWLVTVATVPLPSPYGIVVAEDGGLVKAFREKPLLPDYRINAGFMVAERSVTCRGMAGSLEQEWFPELAAAGELGSYHHDGFWASVDSIKDLRSLNGRYQTATPPWTQRDWR
jgi:glucose-1-phosphate cytidylyltransferase